MRKKKSTPTAIVIYTVWTGDGGSYNKSARFDDFDEAIEAVKSEIGRGRQALIEPSFISRSEWDALPTIDGLQDI